MSHVIDPEALVSVILTKRELATVVAALRTAQGQGFPALSYEMYFNDFPPLERREIDELCRNLEYPGG
ncbi:hypothetical protein EPN52_12590 [bacterium]|nr:MAG: hypothetical protein EPN52_12590 [bacterium]